MGEVEKIIRATEVLFTYALIWSIGANIDEDSRILFNKIIHEIYETFNEKLEAEGKVLMPTLTGDLANTTFYDYKIDFENAEFVSYKKSMRDYQHKPTSFEEIVIPTEDSMKMMEISSKLMHSN